MTKMKTLVPIAVALALVVALVPTAALAATEGSAGGQFTAANVTPDVTAVELYSDSGCTTVADNMSPQTTYYLKVSVTDLNSLADITEIKAKIYYDSAGTDPNESGFTSGDTQTVAILTWTSTPAWAIDPTGGGTTWELVTGECDDPDSLAVSSDVWIFAFKPGKVATESIAPADWDIHARATDDDAATDGMYCLDKGMYFYGEITVNTPSVDWGSVTPGTGFTDDTTNRVTSISVNYLANGDYDEQVKASTPWDGADLDESGTPPADDFSLKADDDATLADAVLVLNSGYTTFDSGSLTDENGNTESSNSLWLKLGQPFADATYSGIIYYQIVNG